MQLPKWAVIHVPHNSTAIPDSVRGQFILSDSELQNELLKMTDHHTLALFTSSVPNDQVIQASVSRLVVDVERFEDDAQEVMTSRGMGVIYSKRHDGQPMRREISPVEREGLLGSWYRPHHLALNRAVDKAIFQHGKSIVIDAHSFPKLPLPYELNQISPRPEICIGTDEFHTPRSLESAMAERFLAAGFEVGINSPFSGAIVPSTHYRKDARVSAVMIEVRRDLYMNEDTGFRLVDFEQVSKVVQDCIAEALCAI